MGVSGECSKRGLRARHAPPCLRASAQSPCSPCGTGGRLGGRSGVSITRFRCPWAVAAPERMTTWSMSLFLTSAKSHEYCRTASAVPWNHSVPPVPGVCDAASTWIGGGGCQPQCPAQSLQPRPAARTSTKPSPPKRMPVPKLYVRDMWRFSDVELNCEGKI